MSFSGKKFKRVSTENLDKMIQAAGIPADRAQYLRDENSAFSFTRLGEETFSFSLFTAGRTIDSTFKLGEELEVERRDGSKVKMIHHLENENCLSQVITDPAGIKSNFKREFDGNRCVLTITSPSCDVQAKIHYEAVVE